MGGLDRLLALGICSNGMSQATYDSLLTTVDDVPQVVQVLLQARYLSSAVREPAAFHRHLYGWGISVKLASRHG